ncbi:NACHT, LRR and PYD domains-containing protein 12-like [Pseudophryne corroboree]|uniref:NACHT, LRR and PYD domains-containing protein 12-like n=1 Tax=Pseudophryne corroboree TaxID=495146 RepID=UPI0030818437
MQEEQSFYISERYVNMTVVSIDHFRQRSQDELTETGRQHEHRMKKESVMLEHISLNKLFRWSRQTECVPSVVMVCGVPGVGKTTLMQKFVYDWVTGKLYQRFAFVFFFKFRHLNKLDEVSLEDMIGGRFPHLERHLGHILQDPGKLLFIFDGLDESSHDMDFTPSQLCDNIKQSVNIGMIVVSLLRKSLLEGCSLIMTSRPTKIAKLASQNTDVFQRVCEIMGFFSGERRMYFDQFFQNNVLSQMAFDHVKRNNTLYTFCYIPSYCWILCTVLSMFFTTQRPSNDQLMSSFPKTLTQLFGTFVSNILTNHSQGISDASELMASIGRMAEHGVENQILVFDERDLGSFCVNTSSHLFSSFMIEAGHSSNVNFSFLHLTLQEFFAALVHYLDYSQKKLQTLLGKTNIYADSRAKIFLCFLCGFLDKSTRSLLSFEFSRTALKDVTSWLQASIADVPHDTDIDMGKCLNIFACLFESQDRTLVKECLGSNRNFAFPKVFHLTPVDCTSLAFVLESCRETEKLDFCKCAVQSECWERLASVLHTIKIINLSFTGLKDSNVQFITSALEHHECRIQHLCLDHNRLTDSSCSQLACAIRRNQSLRKLNLSHNTLEGPHFCDLTAALSTPTCRIEELFLNYNNLTDSSCSQLASAITKLQSLRILGLSHNSLGGPQFHDFVTALSSPTCRIEELFLRQTGLEGRSCSELSSAVRSNQSLRKLDLSGNDLAGPHFGDLMSALSNPACRIEKLVMEDTKLTDEQAPLLAPLSNNTSLTHLDLTSNGFKDHGYIIIKKLIQQSIALTEIRLPGLGWSDQQIQDLKRVHRPGLTLKIS